MIEQEVDQHKKRVFNVLLLFVIIAGAVFAYINYQRDLMVIAVVEISTSVISLGLWFFIQDIKAKNLNYLIIIYLSFFFSIMIFVFSSKGISTTVFVWVYGIPLVSYLLLGLRFGFLYTFVFYTISAFIFFNDEDIHKLSFEPIMYGNFLISAAVIWGLSHAYENANFQAKSMLRKLALFDKLTGLYNRTHLNVKFIQIQKQASIEKKNLSIIAFDLDFFKRINDNYGHTTGDEVLQAFANILKTNLPENASAFRLGGEEFAMLMISQSKSEAKNIAEQIRIQSENISKTIPEIATKVTVSSGITTQDAAGAEFESMMNLADTRMYLAKEKGRNCIVTEG